LRRQEKEGGGRLWSSGKKLQWLSENERRITGKNLQFREHVDNIKKVLRKKVAFYSEILSGKIEKGVPT